MLAGAEERPRGAQSGVRAPRGWGPVPSGRLLHPQHPDQSLARSRRPTCSVSEQRDGLWAFQTPRGKKCCFGQVTAPSPETSKGR